MEQREKRYVPVIVRFDTDGKMRPMEIEFSEGQTFPVDKILDVRRAACQSELRSADALIAVAHQENAAQQQIHRVVDV